MLFRPTWAVLCSWSVIEIAPYCLISDFFEASPILTPNVLFLKTLVDSSDSRGPSAVACLGCSNAHFLCYLGD